MVCSLIVMIIVLNKTNDQFENLQENTIFMRSDQDVGVHINVILCVNPSEMVLRWEIFLGLKNR